MRLWLQELNEIEAPICRTWSQALRRVSEQRLFTILRRRGDGVWWYSLNAVMPLVESSDDLRAGPAYAIHGGGGSRHLQGAQSRHQARAPRSCGVSGHGHCSAAGHPQLSVRPHAARGEPHGGAFAPLSAVRPRPGFLHAVGRGPASGPRSARSVRCLGRCQYRIRGGPRRDTARFPTLACKAEPPCASS